MEKTITIRDLFTNAKRPHGNPIMGVGSKAAAQAVIAYGNEAKDREAFETFGRQVLAALQSRLTGYVDSGFDAKSAKVKMTTYAIADLNGFLATFTVAPMPKAASQPEALVAAKPLSRMTKADLIAQIEFLTAKLAR